MSDEMITAAWSFRRGVRNLVRGCPNDRINLTIDLLQIKLRDKQFSLSFFSDFSGVGRILMRIRICAVQCDSE
jgi:hypothetical protein